MYQSFLVEKEPSVWLGYNSNPPDFFEFLFTGTVAEWIEILKPIGQSKVRTQSVAPRLLGKGRKSIRAGRQVPSLAVGACPNHVKHKVASRLFGSLAFFYGQGTTANGLLGFFGRRQLAVVIVRVDLAFTFVTKQARVVPCDSGDISFVDRNYRREIWIDSLAVAIVVQFLKRQTVSLMFVVVA